MRQAHSLGHEIEACSFATRPYAARGGASVQFLPEQLEGRNE
jgi:hypothetical protein